MEMAFGSLKPYRKLRFAQAALRSRGVLLVPPFIKQARYLLSWSFSALSRACKKARTYWIGQGLTQLYLLDAFPYPIDKPVRLESNQQIGLKQKIV